MARKRINKDAPLTAAEKQKRHREKQANEPIKTNSKLVRIEVIANIVGVTVRRIQQLQQEGIITLEPGGANKAGAKYDYEKSIKSLFVFFREKADKRSSSTYAEEKLRQIKIKNELDELELKDKQGDLHKTEDIEKLVGLVYSRLRINLLAIPMSVAPKLKDDMTVNEKAKIINVRICKALHEIANLDIQKALEEDQKRG